MGRRLISLFSKYMQKILRFIAASAFFLISFICVCNLITGVYNLYDIKLYVNLLALLFISIYLFLPVKIEFLALVTLSYSVELLIAYPFTENQLGLPLFVLTCAILFSRGYFRKKRILKIIISIVIFLCLFSSNLRFGGMQFLQSFLLFLEMTFSLFLIIFFYYLYLRNQGISPIEKYLDLSQFSELTERDKEWLELILQETKYSTIAHQYNVSEGTVKNRMRVIFKILDVSDRIGFMATYGGYELKK